MRRVLILCVALTGVGCVHFGYRAQAEHIVDRRFDGPIDALEARLSSDDLVVSPGKGRGAQVRIFAIARAGSGTRARELTRWLETHPPVKLEGNVLRIEETARNSGFLSEDLSLRYEVTVPAAVRVDVDASSGDVELRGLEGGTALTTSSGDVTVSHARGNVRVSTSSGDVTLTDLHGPVSVNTSSGEVRLRQHGGARAEVETSSGDVELRGARGDLSVHTSSGEVDIDSELGKLARWSIDTGSGNVRVNLGGRPSFKLSVASTSGDIQTELPISVTGRLREDRLTGVVGGAPSSRLVKIDTGSGDVEIRAAQ